MSGIVRNSRAPIVWKQDLTASTATTAYPTSSTQGIALSSFGDTITPLTTGDKIHVALDYTVASGTMSTDVHVYGYVASSIGNSMTGWYYVGGLNGSGSITADAKWSASSTQIKLMEFVNITLDQVSRLYTRCVAPGGTSPVISTYIGVERG